MNPLQTNFTEYIKATADLADSEKDDLIAKCLLFPDSVLKHLYITFTLDPQFISMFYDNLKKKEDFLKTNNLEGFASLYTEEEQYCKEQELLHQEV